MFFVHFAISDPFSGHLTNVRRLRRDNVGFLRISECLTHLERFLQIIFDFGIFARVLKVARILNLEKRSIERVP